MIKYEVRKLTNGYQQFCGEFATQKDAAAEVENLRASSRDVFIVSPVLIPEKGAYVELPKVLSRAAGAGR